MSSLLGVILGRGSNNAMVKNSQRTSIGGTMKANRSAASFLCVLSIVLLSLFLSGCVESQMSTQTASNVVLSMQNTTVNVPPRSASDILEVLKNVDTKDREKVQGLYDKLEMSPPEGASNAELAIFYHERGRAARELGRYGQAYDDLHLSLKYNSKPETLALLATVEYLAGNHHKAIELANKALAHSDSNKGLKSATYFGLAIYYSSIGDLKSCEAVIDRGVSFIDSSKPSPGLMLNRHRLLATKYQVNGEYSQAEPHRRGAVRLLESKKRSKPLVYLHNKGRLDMNLAYQGRLLEAEFGARETVRESIALTGRLSGTTADLVINLGQILLMQGRVDDARKLVDLGVENLAANLQHLDSVWFAEAQMKQAALLATASDYAASVEVITVQQERMNQNREAFVKLLTKTPDALLAMSLAGRSDYAYKLIDNAYTQYVDFLGEEHRISVELRGIRGVASLSNGDVDKALSDFQYAVPRMSEALTSGAHFQRRQRVIAIMKSYADLLHQLWQKEKGRPSSSELVARLFDLTEKISNSAVHSALGAAGARSAVADPDLAKLIRQEQDASGRIEALEDLLVASLQNAEGEPDHDVVTTLQGDIRQLELARSSILGEISKRFEKYSSLVRPQVPSFTDIKGALHDGEALIVLHQLNDKLFVWAIPDSGEVRFNSLMVSSDLLEEKVSNIRRTVDPNPITLNQIPHFDFDSSYWIYTNVMEPVKEGWEDATQLIVAAPGIFGQVPFTLLPRSQYRPESTTSMLFDDYKNASWLIKDYSIARLPTATSLMSVRQPKVSSDSRIPFIGFGDPVFSKRKIASVDYPQEESTALTRRGARIFTRGIRTTAQGMNVEDDTSSIALSDLAPLPDTATEILSISEALGGDNERDVFLGEKASEKRVKTTDLSNRKVVVFATHGLLPGDLDGLEQPALALTSPQVASEGEDGLLTMSEIMQLKLDADLVVLSACNTGAASGSGAEAVSGLGRAFFYAGTKSLLVSMWPVETTSVKRLTTSAFQYYRDEPMRRAEALRKAMLDMIEEGYLRDSDTGEEIASYAHPIFWAPFIVAGDAGNTH